MERTMENQGPQWQQNVGWILGGAGGAAMFWKWCGESIGSWYKGRMAARQTDVDRNHNEIVELRAQIKSFYESTIQALKDTNSSLSMQLAERDKRIFQLELTAVQSRDMIDVLTEQNARQAAEITALKSGKMNM